MKEGSNSTFRSLDLNKAREKSSKRTRYYDLDLMSPRLEAAGKAAKQAAASRPDHRRTIFQDSIFTMLPKSRQLLSRYLVLNGHGLFVYKDVLAFNSFPEKPTIVLPLSEVDVVEESRLESSSSTRLSQSLSMPSQTSALPGKASASRSSQSLVLATYRVGWLHWVREALVPP